VLEEFGAEPLDPTRPAAARAWLRRWLPRLTRTMRHAANHRYAWAGDRRMQWRPTRQAYPKRQPALLEAA